MAEGVVIVVSILLAFGIDAWWDQTQDRTEERHHLERLDAEFELNRERLSRATRSHQQILDQGLALLEVIGSYAEGETRVVSDTLLRQQARWATFDPLDGTLNSLIASGRLGIIRNDELRGALAAWPGLVEDLNEDEENQMRAVRDHLLPHMFRFVSMRQLRVSSGDPRGMSAGPFRTDYAALLSSREFENWVADQVAMQAYLLRPDGDLNELRRFLDRLLELIEAELRE